MLLRQLGEIDRRFPGVVAAIRETGRYIAGAVVEALTPRIFRRSAVDAVREPGGQPFGPEGQTFGERVGGF